MLNRRANSYHFDSHLDGLDVSKGVEDGKDSEESSRALDESQMRTTVLWGDSQPLHR
jgi:hypothetical protein